MNPVLAEILDTGTADPGHAIPLHSHMDRASCELIYAAFTADGPLTSIEVGLAYGISALFACNAIDDTGAPGARHIVIDPCQNVDWQGVGLANLERAGYRHLVDFREEPSELALPKLLAAGTRIQAAIIDGWHTFDHALIDFFYINRMLDLGGIVVIDDTDYPSIAQLARYIRRYPCYELFGETPRSRITIRSKARRAMSRGLPALRRQWDRVLPGHPRSMAFRKIAEDQRPFDWYEGF